MGVSPLAQFRLTLKAISQAQKDDEPPVMNTDTGLKIAETPAKTTGQLLDSMLKTLPHPPQVQAPLRKDMEPTMHLQPVKPLGKPLEIVDFVNLSNMYEMQYEQVVSEVGGGHSLVLK